MKTISIPADALAELLNVYLGSLTLAGPVLPVSTYPTGGDVERYRANAEVYLGELRRVTAEIHLGELRRVTAERDGLRADVDQMEANLATARKERDEARLQWKQTSDALQAEAEAAAINLEKAQRKADAFESQATGYMQKIDEVRAALGCPPEEYAADAARRLVADRDALAARLKEAEAKVAYHEFPGDNGTLAEHDREVREAVLSELLATYDPKQHGYEINGLRLFAEMRNLTLTPKGGT